MDDDRKGRRTKNMFGFSSGDPNTGEEVEDDFIENRFWVEAEGDMDEDRGDLWNELLVQVQQAPPVEIEARTMAPLSMAMYDKEFVTGSLGVEGSKDSSEFVTREIFLEQSNRKEVSGGDDDDDDSSIEDDENLPLMVERFRVTSEGNAWWTGGDEIQNDDYSGRRLKHSHSDRINVAILHISSKTGYDVLDMLLKENSETERLGGPKIVLNSKGTTASSSTIFMWTMLSVAACSCVCCCMVVFVEVVDDDRNESQQPVRRRLSTDQVTESFPSFQYHPEEHLEQCLEDECAICLDDFEEGMRLRKLPCGHVFHSTCVARWLIERHAVCPLCKMDLFEEEDPEVGGAEASALRDRYGALGPITRLFSRPTPSTEAASVTPSMSERIFEWWRTSPSPAATIPEDEGETPNARAASSEQAPRWGTSRLPAASNDQNPTTDISWSSSSSLVQTLTRWFGRPQRRGTEAGGVLTELTEPLMGSDDAEEQTGNISANALSGDNSGSILPVPVEEGETPTDLHADTNSVSIPGPVEV